MPLGVVTLVMVFLTSRRPGTLPRVAEIAGAVVMIALAVLAGIYVFLTGDSLRLDRASEMRDAGCPFVEKPFEPAAIRRIIREALSAAG